MHEKSIPWLALQSLQLCFSDSTLNQKTFSLACTDIYTCGENWGKRNRGSTGCVPNVIVIQHCYSHWGKSDTGGRIRHRYNSWTPFLLMKLHWRLVFALSPSSWVCPSINVNQIISEISVVCWTCIMFVVTVKVVIQSVVAVCCNVPAARSKFMIANTRYRMLLRLRRPIYFRVLLRRQSCCRGVDLLVRFWNKSF